jgi:hypothetical protein
MYVRPHHRTGWRNDAQIRTHEMKVAAREPPIDDRPECVTIYPMTVVRGIMYKLYIYIYYYIYVQEPRECVDFLFISLSFSLFFLPRSAYESV